MKSEKNSRSALLLLAMYCSARVVLTDCEAAEPANGVSLVEQSFVTQLSSGSCPDLMSFEQQEVAQYFRPAFKGVDLDPLWLKNLQAVVNKTSSGKIILSQVNDNSQRIFKDQLEEGLVMLSQDGDVKFMLHLFSWGVVCEPRQ